MSRENHPTSRAAALFVDDDDNVLAAVRRSLAAESYDVITVASAHEALEHVRRRRIDVVVSDEDMPQMTGGQLLEVIAEQYPDILLIMLTGQATLESALHAINACHVYRYLRKPFDPLRLPGIVREAIKKRQRIAMRNESDIQSLSSREREVLSLVARGLRVKDVAGQLSLSHHTVRNHLKAIFRKVDAHSQAELVMRYGPQS